VRALRDRERFEGQGTRWIAEPCERIAPRSRDPFPPPRGRAEQHLHGLRRVGGAQDYRRLTAGPNPEAEVAEFLAARAFANVPALLGLFRLVDADGSETVAGIAQQFVAAIGDGWSYARRRIRDLVILRHEQTPGWAAFLDDCRRLGEITGALHRALCSDASNPDFSPQPVGADDLARWREGLRRQVDTSITLLDASLRSGALAREGKSEARVVLTEARALLDRATAFLTGLGPGRRRADSPPRRLPPRPSPPENGR